MPQITGINHVQLSIPRNGEEKAKAFYCSVLGLAEIEKPHSLQSRGGFWLRVGDLQVHVGVENGDDRTATKAHIAYQVEDLQGWRVRLEQSGIEILNTVPIPGYERF